jgi:hypothetical protein
MRGGLRGIMPSAARTAPCFRGVGSDSGRPNDVFRDSILEVQLRASCWPELEGIGDTTATAARFSPVSAARCRHLTEQHGGDECVIPSQHERRANWDH